MPTSATATPSASRAPRAPPKTAPANSRVTRLRAAKEMSASPAANKPSGLLARGKAELRKVSDKMKEKEKEKGKGKEKEKEKDRVRVKTSGAEPVAAETESLKAFLRIRPSPHDTEDSADRTRPYLELQNDREVLMRAPMDPTRPTIPKASLIYSFDRVFPPSTPQSSFFTTTTLPLVEKLLQGENGLLFAYGVSNSGKTYTISGGKSEATEDRGLLPRAVDVVFNSINGMESKANIKLSGMADVILSDEPDRSPSPLDGLAMEVEASTSETVKVDRNFSYAVFISYVEVYNEKVFDLLDSVLPSPALLSSQSRPLARSGMPRASATYAIGSSMSLAAMANGGGGVLKRRVLQLKPDPEGSGKYISGVNEVRVRTREDALAVFRVGQRARQVFGTLANRESSRSHGIFTVKVVRIHNGAPDDPDSAQVSRLAFVDLAGSERNKNTHTTGDRLKEAGNINKSLMVLGQCLQTLRLNQQKMAAPAAAGVKKKLAMVPFRHSKLTEVFQNFFVGDGRAVMIVNVNPYDTGFDENSHVMRFSAVAREVQTTAANKVTFPGLGLKRQISSQFSALKQAVSGPMKIKVVVPVLPKVIEGEASAAAAAATPGRPAGPVRLVVGGRETDGFVMVEEELEVVEEDEGESEDERDVLVDSLFEQLKELKTRLYESEMRNASVEVEVREEVAKEMQQAMSRMQDDFSRRLQEQVMASELKTDRKIDIVSRMATPAVSRTWRARTDTPASAADTSMTQDTESTIEGDESFASALDLSHISSEGPVRQGRLSDPFTVKKQEVPRVIVTRGSDGVQLESEEEDEDEEDEVEETGDVSQDLDETEPEDETSMSETAEHAVAATADRATLPVGRVVREDTAESEDALAGPLREEDMVDNDTEGEDEDEELTEEDEDDEDEEEDGDEEEEEVTDEASYEEEPDEEAESASDSSFAMSEAASESSEEVEDSPVRRASVRRRTIGSPKKRSSPTKRSPTKSQAQPRGASPAKKPATSTPGTAKKGKALSAIKTGSKANANANAIAEVISSPTASSIASAGASARSHAPLGERLGQDGDEDEIVPTKTKRKRTLGKKVVMEDDMADGEVPGAEVRRMVVGGF